MYKVTEMLLTPNRYSRPQTPLKKVEKIAVHYVGDAGGTAKAVRNYFESLKTGKTYESKGKTLYKFASSHYVIGLDGEVIKNIPENEWSYCTNAANKYSISIECCHPDWSGKFNDKTYNVMVEFCADLCIKYNLNPLTDIIRHYDITKKCCPKFFVDHPKEWDLFKQRVNKKVNELRELINVAEKVIQKSWEQKTGEEAIDALALKGFIKDAEGWKAKDLIKENVPLWLFFEMLRRIDK
jgi:N-acetylmuramoyl-L-alanine amidase CwlA